MKEEVEHLLRTAFLVPVRFRLLCVVSIIFRRNLPASFLMDSSQWKLRSYCPRAPCRNFYSSADFSILRMQRLVLWDDRIAVLLKLIPSSFQQDCKRRFIELENFHSYTQLYKYTSDLSLPYVFEC